ncbi:hypothetical protein LXA43DRAFT_136142 [Ganoderma leucocontextum]|nr:hypothetical protein LXA43DRAFT_136142 [Ganoderma leucocontextum]
MTEVDTYEGLFDSFPSLESPAICPFSWSRTRDVLVALQPARRESDGHLDVPRCPHLRMLAIHECTVRAARRVDRLRASASRVGFAAGRGRCAPLLLHLQASGPARSQGASSLGGGRANESSRRGRRVEVRMGCDVRGMRWLNVEHHCSSRVRAPLYHSMCEDFDLRICHYGDRGGFPVFRLITEERWRSLSDESGEPESHEDEEVEDACADEHLTSLHSMVLKELLEIVPMRV